MRRWWWRLGFAIRCVLTEMKASRAFRDGVIVLAVLGGYVGVWVVAIGLSWPG